MNKTTTTKKTTTNKKKKEAKINKTKQTKTSFRRF